MPDNNNTDSPLVSNEQNEKWLEAVNKDLDSRSHLMPEDEKNAYAMAYVQARNEGKSHQEALAEGRKGQKKRQEERKREEEEKQKREEEEKKRREEEQAMREAHAANEEALGMSFDAGGFMGSLGPTVNEVGADDTDISEESESQMNRGEVNIVVMFSILSIHDLKQTKSALWADGLVENMSTVSSLMWEEGAPINYAEKTFKVFDCSHLQYDAVSGKVVTWLEMMDCLEAAIEEIKKLLFAETESYSGGTIHFSVAGFMPIEALMFAFSELSGRTLTNSALYDVFIDTAKSNFSFRDFTDNGWTIQVDYACIYEVFSLYFERKLYANEIKMLMGLIEKEYGYDVRSEHIPEEVKIAYLDDKEIPYGEAYYSYKDLRDYLPYKKQEEDLWYEYQKAARHAAKVQRMEEEYEFPAKPMEVAHLFLGLASIPFSLLSLVDAGVHAVEWIKDGDESGAHKIGIGIDLVCCIPFVRIFKFLRGGKLISRAAKTGVPALVGNKVKILYYKGKQIVVKRAIKLNKRRRANLRNAKSDVKYANKAVEAGKQDANAARRELQELTDLKTGQQIDDLTIGMLEKELTSGTLSKQMFEATMGKLLEVRQAFQRNGQRLAQLQEKEEALRRMVQQQEKAEQQLAKLRAIYTKNWNIVDKSARYEQLVREQEQIVSEIERLQQANEKLMQDAFKPWASKSGNAIKDVFLEWAKPFSFRNSFKGLLDKEGVDLAMQVEGVTQTLIGGISTVYSGYGMYKEYQEDKQAYYDQLEVETGLPNEMIEVILDDGTVEVTTQTILDLMGAIDELRGTYGYAPNELNGNVVGLRGRPKGPDEYSITDQHSMVRPKSPLDIYK